MRVEIRKIDRVEELLNLTGARLEAYWPGHSSTRRCLCPTAVPPSSRSTEGDQPCCHRQASRMSSNLATATC